MASRPVTQQHNRVEGGAVKQKNMAGAGGRNRRPLGDIGNVVTTRGAPPQGKPLANITRRPVTRSFGAQLLANAQAAAAAENNKKCAAVNVAGAVKIKKPAVNPKPKVVVESSSDSDNGNAGKKAPTLTSTLTARSKKACGLSKRPVKEEENVVDIDAADANNELAVTEYVDQLYRFYEIAEKESKFGDYMTSQPDINEKMRAILIDWLTEVHLKFELSPETLYLTVNIIDRYLSVRTTPRKELQLLGMGAMLLASKYEEIWAPEVNDFVSISESAYTHAQVLAMEKRILRELEWNLTVPTPYVFLVRFIKASVPDSEDMESMGYFLSELGMMNYNASLFCPSMLAASAVFVARCTLKKTPLWDETLKRHTGYSESELVDCAKLLVSYHGVCADHKLKVIFKKYSSPQRRAVALLPPAKSFLDSLPPPTKSV